MKKTTSLVLAFCLLFSIISVSFNCIITANAVSINDNEVFVKQSRSGRCTLASAVMMLRRRAIIDGLTEWNKITEGSTEDIAWTTGGLYNNFSFAGMVVGYGTFPETLDEKKDFMISMLELHPEGFQIYNRDGEKIHAVLLTDYDPYNDVFYCADPAGGISSGRIPLTSAWLPGTTQDERIENLDNYWYISNRTGGLDISSFRSLQYGDENSSVKWLQGALNDALGTTLSVDGQFGKATEDAVKAFQQQYGLSVDGVAGQSTVMKLRQVTNNSIAEEIEAVPHTHNLIESYETAHPHKGYYFCECGYTAYNDKTTVYDDCKRCKAYAKSNRITLGIGESIATIYGKTYYYDVAPQIVGDRTMIPVRYLAEILDANVGWVSNMSDMVVISNDDTRIALYPNSNISYVNGNLVMLDAPSYIYNDRLFVPVRYVAEIIGAEVEWDSENMQVILYME